MSHFRKRNTHSHHHNTSISGPALAVMDAEAGTASGDQDQTQAGATANGGAAEEGAGKDGKKEEEQGVKIVIRLAACDEEGREFDGAERNEQGTYLHVVRFGPKPPAVDGKETEEDGRPWVVKVVKREATVRQPYSSSYHVILILVFNRLVLTLSTSTRFTVSPLPHPPLPPPPHLLFRTHRHHRPAPHIPILHPPPHPVPSPAPSPASPPRVTTNPRPNVSSVSPLRAKSSCFRVATLSLAKNVPSTWSSSVPVETSCIRRSRRRVLEVMGPRKGGRVQLEVAVVRLRRRGFLILIPRGRRRPEGRGGRRVGSVLFAGNVRVVLVTTFLCRQLI